MPKNFYDVIKNTENVSNYNNWSNFGTKYGYVTF